MTEKFNRRKIKKINEGIRLNKFIAHSGICSRREADMHIQIGSVKVNNKVITQMGFKVNSACLLYTSPSPRDGNVSRMPSSA